MRVTKWAILAAFLFGSISFAPAQAAILKLKVSPKSSSFGRVEVNTVSAEKTVTLLNRGASEIAIQAVQIASGPFVIDTDNCSGTTLAPRGSASSTCTISVTFHPVSASNPNGTKEKGSLTITDGAASPKKAKLTGIAFGNPIAGPPVWPMFQHDPAHTGLSQFSTATNTGTTEWSFAAGGTEGGGLIDTSPVIDTDGTLYSGAFFAINPDGTRKQSFTGVGAGFTTPAIGADRTIYVSASNGSHLVALSPNGTKEWSFSAAGTVTSSSVIGADGTIYFGDTQANNSGELPSELYAVNPNGSQKWRFRTGFGVRSSPAIDADGTIYVGSDDSKLYALNPDGTKKWSFLTGGQVESSAAIGGDGTIYFGSNDGNLYALNPEGTEIWNFPIGPSGGEETCTPAIGPDGTIYMIGTALFAVNPNGSDKWTFQTNSFSSPAVASEGTVYVGNGQGTLIAVNPDGSQKWQLSLGSTFESILSTPAIGSDGTIYVGSADGTLHAVQ